LGKIEQTDPGVSTLYITKNIEDYMMIIKKLVIELIFLQGNQYSFSSLPEFFLLIGD
jgi:hypothetical protein